MHIYEYIHTHTLFIHIYTHIHSIYVYEHILFSVDDPLTSIRDPDNLSIPSKQFRVYSLAFLKLRDQRKWPNQSVLSWLYNSSSHTHTQKSLNGWLLKFHTQYRSVGTFAGKVNTFQKCELPDCSCAPLQEHWRESTAVIQPVTMAVSKQTKKPKIHSQYLPFIPTYFSIISSFFVGLGNTEGEGATGSGSLSVWQQESHVHDPNFVPSYFVFEFKHEQTYTWILSVTLANALSWISLYLCFA